MARVIAALSTSLDGFMASPSGDVGPLFELLSSRTGHAPVIPGAAEALINVDHGTRTEAARQGW